jgi:hypothetical protein
VGIAKANVTNDAKGIQEENIPTSMVNKYQYQNSERRARPVKSAYFEKHVLIAVTKSIVL